MAHKTLIGGTEYKIIGGKTLIDGTTYNIMDGKTLIDETVYNIEKEFFATLFITKNVFLSFTGNEYIHLEINGQKITDNCQMQVPIGTVVTCCIRSGEKVLIGSTVVGRVWVNGELVGEATGTNITYDYSISTGATFILKENADELDIFIVTYPNIPVVYSYGFGASQSSCTINGMKLEGNSALYIVPIGSIMECVVTTQTTEISPIIMVNNEIVSNDHYSYEITCPIRIAGGDYTVQDDSGAWVYYGHIEITETI